MIVQHLRAIQNRFGFLPDAELERLSRETGIALPRIEEVASFYASFRQERDRSAVLEVRVCRDMTCHHRGAADLLGPEGLQKLCADPSVTAALRENGPNWTAAERERARAAGELSELIDPPPEVCRAVVEGVSCLGRCDRAPAVWVERHPMPAGEHAWVFARRADESADQFRARLEAELRNIAADKPCTPDPDAAYPPNTNADARFHLPVVPPEQKPAHGHAHDPLPSPRWAIDPYHAKERDYAAVRRIAAWLRERGGLPKWPSRAEQDAIKAAAVAESTAPPADAEKVGRKRVDEVTKQLLEGHKFLREFQKAGLQGMGGAGMPTFDKWRDVWQKPDAEKYVICNGDESEPGTFKDRELLLRTPHLVVEGLVIAGLLTGAAAGFLYIRHEYPEQIHAIQEEIHRAERLGACGANVFGTGVTFPVKVVESPGGYICGEQSALIEAMEDKRSQPRNRPPELAANGYRDKPTAVNNVETLAWAPVIVLNEGAQYAAGGWPGPLVEVAPYRFKGRRLFSVSGDVARPGVFEVPNGLPLGELLLDPRYCGGVVRGTIKAIAPSGPSSGLLPPILRLVAPVPGEDRYEKWLADAVARLRTPEEQAVLKGFVEKHLPPGATTLELRHVPLDLSFFRNIHALLRLPAEPMLGAGITVFAGDADPLDLAVNFTRFFRNESCGKCVPCRLGSQKLFQIGTELLAKRAAGTLTVSEVYGASKDDPACVRADVKLLNDVLQPTSICGLGYVAPIPLNSALAYFRSDILKAPKTS